MTATHDDTIAVLQLANAELRQERDAALAREATLAEALATRTAELATRNVEYVEQIEHQLATVDVLSAMSESPGDPQPVFVLITRHASECCNSRAVLWEFDGKLMHFRASHGAGYNLEAQEAIIHQFPAPPDRGVISARAVLEQRLIHIADATEDPEIWPLQIANGARSYAAIPLMRDGKAIGAISMNSPVAGGFADSQLELLKTFAEQAVIAITSAETYRALQSRTADLQEMLEYQTATSDVLKVISRSTFDLQPVLDALVETAARLCNADQAVLARSDGKVAWLASNFGFPTEYEAYVRSLGIFPVDEHSPLVAFRALCGRHVVHIHDVAAVPNYPDHPISLGKQRTSLGVPLLREGEPAGVIVLARTRVEPFSDRQIELVSTFAAQAVIAIENTRLLTETREALEQQTATADVLRVINGSPGDLVPVFNTILEWAHRVCDADGGVLFTYDGTHVRVTAVHGYPSDHAAEMLARAPYPPPNTVMQQMVATGRFIQVEDVQAARDRVGAIYPQDLAVSGMRTAAAIPLLKDGRLNGYITAWRRDVRLFSDKQIALLENFAAQAVIAMENARLLRELQEALDEQTATAEVLRVINASPGNLAPVFAAMIDKAARLTQSEFGVLAIYDGSVFHAFSGEQSAPETLNPEPGSALGDLVDGAPFVHIPDVMDTDAYRARVPSRVRLVEGFGARTCLWISMRKDDALLGVLASYRREVRPFSDHQIYLLQNFAAQAVIAMQNARLINEQREALEQQTATAEVLQVINASPGNLAPVFEAILEKAHRICNFDMGSLATYDGTFFRAVATRGYDDQAEVMARTPYRPLTAQRALLRGDRLIHIPDTQAYPVDPNDAAMPAFFTASGFRACLMVPLRKDGTLHGFLTGYRKVAGPFSEKQIALLENFAAQAVIAMENARLLTETREALEQQTATAEVLQVINSSPGDLGPVFDAMLERAMRLCQANFGAIGTFDGERMKVVALRGIPAAYGDYIMRNPVPNAPGTIPGRIINGESIVHIQDLVAEANHRNGHSDRGALVELGGARTSLSVALRKDDTLLGMLSFYRQEVRPFNERQTALLQSFAAQAVIAIENARLITEQREALEQQTATSEVLQVINSSPGDLTPVFDAILDKAQRVCSVDHAALEVYDDERMHAVAVHGATGKFAEILRQGYRATDSPAARALLEGQRFAQIADATQIDHIAFRTAAEVDGVRTVLFVPLRRDDTFLGMIGSARREVRLFSEKEIALLENFAAQAVIAMENARLLTEQREALEQQTATAEILQVINASPGNLTPVFDAIMEQSLRLCEAAFGSLCLYEDGHESYRAVAMHSLPDALAELFHDKRLSFRPESAFGRIARGESPIHVIDAAAAEAGLVASPVRRATVEIGGAHTALWVALRKDQCVLGAIVAWRREIKAFTPKQIALVENFAAQAVIAIENARLLNELRARTDELALRQTELRVTFENMGDGVAMFDEAQHLVAWNRKFRDILDMPDDIIARRQTFTEYVRYLAERGEYGPEADPEEHVRGLIEQAGQSRTYERTRPDGRVIEIRSNPVPSGGFVLIYADITERKRNEAEIHAARDAAEEASRTIEAAYRDLKAAQANLIQAEKMASLGQLTAGIAHEIKNPLNFVNNFSALSTELIDELQDVLAPEPLGETARTEVNDLTALLKGNLEKVVQHGQRADGIVRSMLDHSRGSSGERRTVDLNALIDEALNLAYHGARAQDQSFNITLERVFGAGIAPIEVNPQDITRVFLNLFANGFYAVTRRAREGGDAAFVPILKVTTRDTGEAVEIRVRDNGTGIPADIRDKLFQPFFTTKPTGEGTGLGLSITYDIVTQQHGGSIGVDSKVGEYSEFTIRLPRNP